MPDIAATERPAACASLRAGEPFVGKQGFTYAAGDLRRDRRRQAIHMQLLTDPAGRPRQGAQARGARDRDLCAERRGGRCSTASGSKFTWSRAPATSSTFPPTCRICPITRARPSPASRSLSRTDPNEQESVVLLPAL